MGLGTDTNSKSYIRIKERDTHSFKLCPERKLTVLRKTSKKQWGTAGVQAGLEPLSAGSVKKRKKSWVVQNDPPEMVAQNDGRSIPNKFISSLVPKSVTETGWDSDTSRGAEKPSKASRSPVP